MDSTIPYGFIVERTSGIFTSNYAVIDASRDKVIMEAEFYGGFKPQFNIMDMNQELLITTRKTSFWGDRWEIKRKGIILAEVRKSIGSICNQNISIITDSEQFIVSRSRINTFQAIDRMGKEVFLFEKESWTLKEKFLLEVSDEFDPLVALSVSLILNYIIKQQQVASSTAVIVST